MMPADEVVRVVAQLEEQGIPLWLDGGWGVDALVGRQTRDHQDLDVAILLVDVARGVRLLGELGYAPCHDELPTRLTLRDAGGRQVDLHPLTLDDNGNGLQRLQDGSIGTYPAEGLRGTGRLSGRPVPCLTRDLQLLFHRGYELDDDDRHDVRLLEELEP